MEDFSLKNWIPYGLKNQDGMLLCNWLNTGQEPFVKPFFDETISQIKSKRRVGSFTSSSSLSMMEDWSGNITGISPGALIFHTSRCGSTLIAQLLATANQHIVLPEVPFFDDLLRLPYRGQSFGNEEILNLLRAAISYYGQVRTGQEQRLFIKTDSWHMLFFDQLRALYPTVPFVLMYRHPAEIFRSLKKVPGLQSVPGLIEPAVFGFNPDEMYDLDTYIGMVLAKYFQQYLNIIAQDDNCLMVNYNEGPMPLINKIAAFTNTPLSSTDLAAMTARSQYHSKRPTEVFVESITGDVPACLEKAMELYLQVEEKRFATA
ncbi:sulfotransferase family protein [Mucilaginibacter yixingensis]|uniref:Sulfotransferase family protein n=1 Tax=Mucilaginibacter yixingensis TaxID=1295612 RepID=A0A2T5JCF9_9SPHI|nr:sulfotransferase [Mucilaginibacter yixingensis]PTQ99450.1 sulfotransferase family protein [Mucilaginibacter yixingensis]